MDHWTATQITEQSGRTFIVTGANSGLGFETTRQLAAHGGRMVMATRSEAKGLDAVARLKAAQPDAAVEFRALDRALSELYAAVDPAAESGRFYGPDGFGEMRGYPA